MAAACGGDNWAPVSAAEPLRLLALQEVLQVKPGSTGRASFLLTTLAGIPKPNERLDFSVIDDPQTPTNDLAGATLAASSGLTDSAGVGMVTVAGGLRAMFRLSARHPRAGTAEVLVDVTEGMEGTLAAVATPVAGSTVTSQVTSVDVRVIDARFCNELSLISPPIPARPVKTVAPGVPADFNVSNLSTIAIVAQGRDDDGKLRAAGCIDVPGETIVPGNVVWVYVPLSELDPIPRGTFVLSSHFSLAKRELAQRLAAPWQDLADCPLDPGQIWLDCAIDALGSPAAGDPLDCVPAPTGEGDLADLIMTRRGVAALGSSCRASTFGAAGGEQSLDAKVARLFPSPASGPVAGLPSLGVTLASILNDFTLGSTLTVEATASPGLFQATHTLRSALFQVGGTMATVDVVAQGNPAAQTPFVPVATDAGTLSIDAHRLSLRLGSLAHVAFSKVALVGHGWPAATRPYLDMLFGLAASGTGAARKVGCDALDTLVCADVGRPDGCLRAACVAGQAALAARLDGAFALVDGDGGDLQLSGSAAMADDNDDGFADRLGASQQDPGLWTAQIRARAGTEILSGSWLGTPLAP
jgi:hypothetical protein